MGRPVLWTGVKTRTVCPAIDSARRELADYLKNLNVD
jgi:hypothetical protein